MPSKPESRRRKWPHYAQWARDDTGALLQEILRTSRELQCSHDAVVAAKAGLISDRANRAIRYLNTVGAQIPEDSI